MKTALVLSVVFLGSLCPAGEDLLVNPLGFSLEISAPESMPVEGPCPLRFTLKYDGDRRLRIRPLVSLLAWRLEVGTPEGWKPTWHTTLVSACAPSAAVERPWLAKGSVVTDIVYLHELFSKCTPGKTELHFTLTFFPVDLDRPLIVKPGRRPDTETLRVISERTVVLRSSVVVDLTAEGGEKLKQRIEAIVSRVGQEKDRRKRIELCRSVAGLTHPCLVPVLLQWLSDRLLAL